jgi:ferredoxin-fold anticodon binding domain-containing protein
MSREKVYDVYRGESVMALKKTESITYRTDKQVRDALNQVAEEKKWSVSQLTEEIIRQWFLENRPDLLKEKN